MERRKRRAFTKAYKAEVVELVRKGGKSVGGIAKELDLTETAVRAWVRQAEVDAGRGPAGALTTEEREELSRLRREVQTLRMEREILKNDGLLRQGEQVRFAFVAVEKALYPVRLLCRCLEVSRAGFYAWQRRPISARAREDAGLCVEIAVSHTESRRTYGSPRILRDLRERGRRVSRKRVARLMRQQGLAGSVDGVVSSGRRTRIIRFLWRRTS